jgi:hypothetical protein
MSQFGRFKSVVQSKLDNLHILCSSVEEQGKGRAKVKGTAADESACKLIKQNCRHLRKNMKLSDLVGPVRPEPEMIVNLKKTKFNFK